MKKRKTKKMAKKAEMQKPAFQPKPENLTDEQPDYGGMNLTDFKKNLGCGS